MDDTHLTRRAFLAGACAALALGVSQAALAEAAEVSAVPAGSKATIRIAGTALATVGGLVTTTVNGLPAAVVRTGNSTFTAITLICPHASGPLRRTSNGWECRIHGSRFTLLGSRVSGPTPRGLWTLPTSLSRGVLTVG